MHTHAHTHVAHTHTHTCNNLYIYIFTYIDYKCRKSPDLYPDTICTYREACVGFIHSDQTRSPHFLSMVSANLQMSPFCTCSCISRSLSLSLSRSACTVTDCSLRYNKKFIINQSHLLDIFYTALWLL